MGASAKNLMALRIQPARLKMHLSNCKFPYKSDSVSAEKDHVIQHGIEATVEKGQGWVPISSLVRFGVECNLPALTLRCNVLPDPCLKVSGERSCNEKDSRAARRAEKTRKGIFWRCSVVIRPPGLE